MVSGINDADLSVSRWFVTRAYKNEKKAELLLKEAGLSFFIAKHYEVRTYHGKKYRVLVPVIPGIVFIYACRKEIQEFRSRFSDLSLQYVMKGRREVSGESRYLTVPERQMENFIKIAAHYKEEITYYKPEEIALDKGIRIRVHRGVFDGVEGILAKVKGKRNKRVVVIEEIAVVATTEITPDLIEILTPEQNT